MVRKYMIYGVLLALLSGCTNYMYYYETEPPRVSLEADQNDILFISRFDTTVFDFNQKKKVELYNEGYKKYIQGVIDGFNMFVVNIRWQEADSLGLPVRGQALSQADVQRLCHDYQSDMLLVLEDFDMERYKEVDVEEKEDGSKSRTAHFYVVTRINMLLFDAEGRIIDNMPIEREEHLSSRSVLSGLFAIGPALGNRDKEIYPMLTAMGKSYVENFRPQQVSVQEQYYASGELKPVRKLIKNGDLEAAKTFLTTLYEDSEDLGLRSRVAHNMWLIHMVLEDIAAAEKWERRIGD